MASFAQHLFVFSPKRVNNQTFTDYFFHNLAQIPDYSNKIHQYTLHLPQQDEDFYSRSEEGWSLKFIADQYEQSPHGGFFDLIHQPTQASHGFSLHFNNLDSETYLILDWRVSTRSLLIDEKNYLLWINEFLKADKIYTAANWLDSVCFAQLRLETIIRRSSNIVQIL